MAAPSVYVHGSTNAMTHRGVSWTYGGFLYISEGRGLPIAAGPPGTWPVLYDPLQDHANFVLKISDDEFGVCVVFS